MKLFTRWTSVRTTDRWPGEPSQTRSSGHSSFLLCHCNANPALYSQGEGRKAMFTKISRALCMRPHHGVLSPGETVNGNSHLAGSGQFSSTQAG